MSKIFIIGLTNVEVTCPINEFPIEYSPINFMEFGISSTVSGVGYNLTKAFKTLGDEVNLCTMVGLDANGQVITEEIEKLEIATDGVIKNLKESFASIILYDNQGRRRIFCDLKDLQKQVFPIDIAEKKLKQSSIAILCNTNISRPYLKLAKELNIPIVTDVHVIESIDDEYHKEFLQYADILFMSNEKINETPEEFVIELSKKYMSKIIVVGLGNEGALLYVREDNFLGRFPAVTIFPVVNTVGAGDSLLTAFVHFYAKDYNPYEAIKKAQIFAANKIRFNGGASGFIEESEVLDQYNKYYL